MPCDHTLKAYLHAYLDGTGIAAEPKGPLFRTIRRDTGQLNTTGRRALVARICTKIGNHTFRATGITAYLKNGGTR